MTGRAGRAVAQMLGLPLLILFLTACQGGEPDACDEGGTLFSDDFGEERDCGWAVYDRGAAKAEIIDGALSLQTSQPGQIWWTNPGRNFDDVILAGEVAQVEGSDDNAFGFICRYQSPENFYVFLISGDGYYAIGKYQSGSNQIVYLTGDGQFVAADEINRGAATNRIRASCIGDELTFSVNGVLMETVSDQTFVIGDIGVAASTFQPGTLEVRFDNLRAIAP